MPKINIKKDQCKGCMLCIKACPRKLIVKSDSLNKRGMHAVEFIASADGKKCSACAMCAIMCPDVCIEVWK